MHPSAWSVPMTWVMPAGVTFTVTVVDTEWVRAPEVPVTEMLYVPGVTDGPKFTVSEEVADPSEGGVTGFVPNAVVKPLGGDGTLRVTAKLNSSTAFTW